MTARTIHYNIKQLVEEDVAQGAGLLHRQRDEHHYQDVAGELPGVLVVGAYPLPRDEVQHHLDPAEEAQQLVLDEDVVHQHLVVADEVNPERVRAYHPLR